MGMVPFLCIFTTRICALSYFYDQQGQTVPAALEGADNAVVKHKTAKHRCSGRSGQGTSKTHLNAYMQYITQKVAINLGVFREGGNGSPSTTNTNFRKHRCAGRRRQMRQQKKPIYI